MKTCTKCGVALDPNGRFCGTCGAPIPVVVAASGNGSGDERGTARFVPGSMQADRSPANDSHDPSAGTLATGSTWSAGGGSKGGFLPRNRIVPVVAGIAALALVVVSVMVHLGVRHDLSRTEAELSATQSSLEATQTELQDTQDELAASNANLAEVTDERDKLSAHVDVLEGRLEGIQGTLSDARNELNLQAGQITTLKTCLNGVSIALKDVLNLDYYGAASALQAVRGPCEEAFQLL